MTASPQLSCGDGFVRQCSGGSRLRLRRSPLRGRDTPSAPRRAGGKDSGRQPIFFIVIASHGALDAMTSGGLGIAFFAPFPGRRYFFPWRPILVSPIGVQRFFSPRGMAVLASEIVWVWVPSAMVGAAGLALRRRQRTLQAERKD
jgi:LexA-binding, inner membrane-associated putative hydrolase